MDYIQINPDNVAPVPRRPRTNKVAAYLFYRQLVSGGGGIVTDDLVLRSNFYDMANLGLDFPADGSAVFNGTSDYIQLPDSGLPSGTSARTITAWIYPNANDNGRIFSYGTGATNQTFEIITQASTNYLAIIGYSNNYFSTATISLNQWAFVSATLSSGTLKMYINGSEVYSNGSATINTTLSGLARIGKSVWDVSDWDGNLANVAIWNRALTSDEINSVMWKSYGDLSGSETSGLQAWYALDATSVFTDWYTYATNQGAVIEGRTCVDNALNALAQL